MNLFLGYLFVETHCQSHCCCHGRSTRRKLFAGKIGNDKFMSRLAPASVFDREGEIPVPAKVWVFFAHARATKRILIDVRTIEGFKKVTVTRW